MSHRICCKLSELLIWFGLQQHRFSYNEPMPVESCTQSLCGLALQFGEDDEDKDRMVHTSSKCEAMDEHNTSPCRS